MKSSAVNSRISQPAKTVEKSTVSHENSFVQLGPYSLVDLAYQGGLIEQGVPEHSTLVKAYRIGQMSATLLVERAVQMKLLPTATLSNSAYLTAVETSFLLHC
ncbi:MAG: hypothetical protein HC769_22835 [Cyanobacteria bacterium CRU_2_1]|nr:hypothetical protein [Cyanobacteria bacterium CRU_2_1]